MQTAYIGMKEDTIQTVIAMQIGESFKQLGLSGSVSNILVGRFNATPEQVNPFCKMEGSVLTVSLYVHRQWCVISMSRLGLRPSLPASLYLHSNVLIHCCA